MKKENLIITYFVRSKKGCIRFGVSIISTIKKKELKI